MMLSILPDLYCDLTASSLVFKSLFKYHTSTTFLVVVQEKVSCSSQAGLQLAMWLRVTLNSCPACTPPVMEGRQALVLLVVRIKLKALCMLGKHHQLSHIPALPQHSPLPFILLNAHHYLTNSLVSSFIISQTDCYGRGHMKEANFSMEEQS